LIFLFPFVLHGTAVIYDGCRGFCAARGSGTLFSAAVAPLRVLLKCEDSRLYEGIIPVCSTVDILRMFYLNVLFLSGAKERGQKESARHIPWCLIPARVVGACRTRRFAAQTASARTPPPLAFMSLASLGSAVVIMPEGQNLGAVCFAVLEFECLLSRKLKLFCGGHKGGIYCFIVFAGYGRCL
jgi:hypothetical protein